jgi:carboxyl-terminal processing protease
MKDNKIYHFFSPESDPPNDRGDHIDSMPPEKPKNSQFFTGMLIGVLLMMAGFLLFGQIRTLYNLVRERPMAVNDKIDEIMSILNTHSINPFEEDELKESMFRGLLAGVGDPYTTYLDRNTFASFMQSAEGTYGGIGVVVQSDPIDKIVTIHVVFEGTPGASAGLQPGDKFMGINGKDVSSAGLEEVTSLTQGRAGTSVRLTIYRPSEDRLFDVNIVREQINIPTVNSEMLDDNIGYIRISSFDRVTVGQFQEAFDELNDQQMRGLIIDLRNNPGGLLDVVTKITNLLTPEGIIVYTEDVNGNREYIYSDSDYFGLPLVVLVNGFSASASEVLSGAVRDLNVGTLVGETTFGKGIVQNLYPLSDGSAIKVTVAKYFTPGGISIQGEGLTPDYIVEMSSEDAIRISQLEFDEDVQLSKAHEVILNMIVNVAA